MGNQLFQQAREAVQLAEQAAQSEDAVSAAKNALSSAYANSTIAEKKQLRELQNRLDNLQH
ncbi:DUF3813 domain-containing protein [Cytobacillus sp. IB215665]|uniref:DUF3813 domain-containing protein n=1 Tax=Cytobacillus sp. IB215665 TaxID=3097357 RepID=UPI002A0E4701|nr:DUF3813 domain-containing protein [Cytobacillus sp. IB215665]MDX8364516.1 DUF3813 domain-containing protein [Cytobacillus sp. IB215665]